METAECHAVARPATDGKNAPENTWTTVGACLEHDRRLLDASVTEVEAFVQERDFAVAAEYFALFRRRLETHIDAEETILFPLFELATGCNGPTSVMRREHDDIRRVLRTLSATLSGRQSLLDPLSLFRELTRWLASHNEKEERVLYPAVDASAAVGGELVDLVSRVEAFLELR